MPIMGKEVRADPIHLCELAGSLTTIASNVRDGLSTAREQITVPTSAFGNSAGVDVLDSYYADLLEDTGMAVEDVAGVYEADIDVVYRIAFAYQDTDINNSNNIPHTR